MSSEHTPLQKIGIALALLGVVFTAAFTGAMGMALYGKATGAAPEITGELTDVFGVLALSDIVSIVCIGVGVWLAKK